MITLALDASTYVGSVAVFDGDRVLAEGEAAMRGRDVELLMPTVSAVLERGGRGASDVGRIVCGAGPGSFTSLRIAASIAKGMAVARDIPLFEVSSLGLIVAGNVGRNGAGPARYLAVLDAMRGECFAAVFECAEGVVTQSSDPRILRLSDVAATAEAERATLAGPGHGNGWHPRARGVGPLSRAVFGSGPVNLAVWEPSYGRLAEAQVKWETAHGRTLPR